MVQKLVNLILLTFGLAQILVVLPDYCPGNELKETSRKDTCIEISMTLRAFNGLKCRDFVPFPENRLKQRQKDHRVRKYYHYKPLPSVTTRQSDLDSYFEIVFENKKLAEINQYSLGGDLIKKHMKIHCQE
jgi:hypothetical protein